MAYMPRAAAFRLQAAVTSNYHDPLTEDHLTAFASSEDVKRSIQGHVARAELAVLEESRRFAMKGYVVPFDRVQALSDLIVGSVKEMHGELIHTAFTTPMSVTEFDARFSRFRDASTHLAGHLWELGMRGKKYLDEYGCEHLNDVVLLKGFPWYEQVDLNTFGWYAPVRVVQALDNIQLDLKLDSARLFAGAPLLPTLVDPEPQAAAKNQRYPGRAAWLKQKMRNLGWTTAGKFQEHGGPDRKTIKKILAGLPVTESTLEKVAVSLSAAGGEVHRSDIPDN